MIIIKFICRVFKAFKFLFFTSSNGNDENDYQNENDNQNENCQPYDKDKMLFIAVSTGFLASRKHIQGLPPNQEIHIPEDDCFQNFIIFGGIGSGKTSRVIGLTLIQLFNRRFGGLIFDIKGDFCDTVDEIGEYTGQNYAIVGVDPENWGFNLISGISPELAASYIQSIFILQGGGNNNDSFWVDSATQLCQNALVLLKLAEQYDLCSLYKFIFYEDFRDNSLREANKNAVTSHERAHLDNAMSYYFQIYEKFDEKVKQSIKATVSQVLSGFQNPVLVDAFCSNNKEQVYIEECLTGQVILVNLPLAEWGTSAKAVYTLIKLRFFSLIQQRATRKDLDDKNGPIFFMCDEYQDIISASKSGMSDLNFWDKSRSGKCIGIISSQSISSFRAAIGNQQTADTVLQNFRQKICFRTEDMDTINYFQQLAGKTEVARITITKGKSKSGGWLSGQRSKNDGESTSLQERNVIDAQLIRSLGMNTGLVFLNIRGKGVDDVGAFCPYYEAIANNRKQQ